MKCFVFEVRYLFTFDTMFFAYDIFFSYIARVSIYCSHILLAQFCHLIYIFSLCLCGVFVFHVVFFTHDLFFWTCRIIGPTANFFYIYFYSVYLTYIFHLRYFIFNLQYIFYSVFLHFNLNLSIFSVLLRKISHIFFTYNILLCVYFESDTELVDDVICIFPYANYESSVTKRWTRGLQETVGVDSRLLFYLTNERLWLRDTCRARCGDGKDFTGWRAGWRVGGWVAREADRQTGGQRRW